MYINFDCLYISMKKIKPLKKITIKSEKKTKFVPKSDLNKDITLNLKKIETISLNIYLFFILFILIGLTHFLYISLGFIGFEIYYLYIIVGLFVFHFSGKKAIKFAFNYGIFKD